MRQALAQIYCLCSLSLLLACSSEKKTKEQANPVLQEEQPGESGNGYAELISSIVQIETFDNGRFLESENAFFIDSDLLACRLQPVVNATSARVIPWDETKSYQVKGFIAVDRINDVVLLQVEGINKKGIRLHGGSVAPGTKSVYLTKPQGQTLPLHNGKVVCHGTVKGSKRYQLTNLFRSQSYGTPVFITPDQCIGIGYSEIVDYENQNFAIPSDLISDLLKKKRSRPEPLQNLKSSDDQATSAANSKIKGLLIETDMENAARPEPAMMTRTVRALVFSLRIKRA